jgi:hypothetical protein
MGRGPLYPVAKSPLRWVTPGAVRSRAPSGRDVASGLRIDNVWMSGREVGGVGVFQHEHDVAGLDGHTADHQRRRDVLPHAQAREALRDRTTVVE